MPRWTISGFQVEFKFQMLFLEHVSARASSKSVGKDKGPPCQLNDRSIVLIMPLTCWTLPVLQTAIQAKPMTNDCIVQPSLGLAWPEVQQMGPEWTIYETAMHIWTRTHTHSTHIYYVSLYIYMIYLYIHIKNIDSELDTLDLYIHHSYMHLGS